MNIKNEVYPGIQEEPLEMPVIHGIEADTEKGLSSYPKYLLAKYLYDDKGSLLFEKITRIKEYYLTDSEKEIFKTNRKRITDYFYNDKSPFNLIEFGSGFGIKTRILIQSLIERKANFRFIPVDISLKASSQLFSSFSNDFPSLEVELENTDYFELISRQDQYQDIRKVIMFLGSSIGNLNEQDTSIFLKNLSRFCRSGDMILIGFDLKKSPGTIMNAYNDPYGLTTKFTVNHLSRLNRELDADFNLRNFEHHTVYEPVSGKVKSFLVSTVEQTVYCGVLEKSFHFKQWEPIFMELSQKYVIEDIENLAHANGFRVEHHFTDERNYFADSLWIKV